MNYKKDKTEDTYIFMGEKMKKTDINDVRNYWKNKNVPQQ